MQDYPQDTTTISEVFHAEKILLDIPSGIAPPTIRVNGKIFYVDELLQRSSGAYFIPERFFCRAKTGAALEGDEKFDFFAIGYDVERLDVSLHLRIIILLPRIRFL